MTEIRYVKPEDKKFWLSLDMHLSESEFENKVRSRQGYVLTTDGKPVGPLRYNLFWDNTPFCNMVFVDWDFQHKGFGKQLVEFWENDMRSLGFDMVLTSTQVDESAQHFYRKLGYKDCGSLVVDTPGHRQPMEMFMVKSI